MKKMIGLFLGILLLPMVTLAEELPKEGVHYFLEYPNGEEQVTANYEEAINPQEKLIYTGFTDSNGNVTLNGWNQSGQLRIVQKVPNGYSTDTRELTVNLSEKQAKFVDYKGVLNPKTGQSLMIILLAVGSIVGISIITVKKNKKALFLLIIPILTLGFNKVKAEGEDFIIKVHDKEGNPLSNVEVEVYAKPSKVEASPAVIFNANGGNFLDGTEKIYVRIPYNDCTKDELGNSLTEEKMTDLLTNIMGVYRENYQPLYDEFFNSSTLTNGLEININWQSDSTAKLVTIDGNGGSLTINNKTISSIKGYINTIENILGRIPFKKNQEVNIGYDLDSSCSSYDENGLLNRTIMMSGSNQDYPSILYACYHNKPDGIYVNDETYYPGNFDSCFEHYHASIDDSSIKLRNQEYNKKLSILNYTNDNINFAQFQNEASTPVAPIVILDSTLVRNFSKVGRERVDQPITKIEIVEHGKVVVTIEASDLSLTNDSYQISNTQKRDQVLSYFAKAYDNECISSSDSNFD